MLLVVCVLLPLVVWWLAAPLRPGRATAALEADEAERAELEAARDAGLRLDIRVLGLASIAQDVTPELARAAIGSVVVLGALHASPAVKAALADRTR